MPPVEPTRVHAVCAGEAVRRGDLRAAPPGDESSRRLAAAVRHGRRVASVKA